VSHLSVARKQRRVPFWGLCTSSQPRLYRMPRPGPMCSASGTGDITAPRYPLRTVDTPGPSPRPKPQRSTSAWPRWRRQARVSSTRNNPIYPTLPYRQHPMPHPHTPNPTPHLTIPSPSLYPASVRSEITRSHAPNHHLHKYINPLSTTPSTVRAPRPATPPLTQRPPTRSSAAASESRGTQGQSPLAPR
jgi:hypothetical protein